MSHTVNIISNSDPSKTGGPAKVLANTMKGLERIGQPFILNKPVEIYQWNWVHDNPAAFIRAAVKKIPVVAGPNLFVLPGNFPYFLPDISKSIFLSPSRWCVDLWKQLNFTACRLQIWPVGIDWQEFSFDVEREEKQILIYFKKRERSLLETVYQKIDKCGFKSNLIEYGNYSENEYKAALRKSIFGVWVGTTESQGIAMQEALASDLPLIVLNSTNILDHRAREILDLPVYLKYFKATSVPYFDKRCGMVIDSLADLDEALVEMSDTYKLYKPREFIEENLSLEKSAGELVNYFQTLDLSGFDYKKIYLAGNTINEIKIKFISFIHFLRNKYIRIIRIVKYRLIPSKTSINP